MTSALPDYAPVPLKDEIAELRRQLAIVRNVTNKQVARGKVHPAYAAAELQCLQSALHTLEKLALILGPDAVAVKDQKLQALLLSPGTPP